MRRPKKRPQDRKVETVSPHPTIFKINGNKGTPEDLKRELSTRSQTVQPEEYILYGTDDALPLRIAQAVEESPAASSCIDTISRFIKGSGFSDPELMGLVIDKDGTTLWDLHCNLSDSLALYWGFAVNFKYNKQGRIINAFPMSFENCRIKKKPDDPDPYVKCILYNPYFGTIEKKLEHTVPYSVFDIKELKNSLGKMTTEEMNKYPGQIYYYGKTSPLSRFYPKPKYWSAKEAIQADHKLQEFVNEELDNGFFQSVLINAIGDPSQMSQNPRFMKEVEKEDGTIVLEPTKTIGEEFNDQMGATFSGSKKAGTALVLWSQNSDTSVKVQAFPTTINSDRLTATQDTVIKIITIATEVPSILANISEGVSLGSGGSEIQKAVELMQSRTVEWRQILENFYNNILLPNFEAKLIDKKVEIQQFNPVSEPVEIDDKVWEFLNEQEKIAFIKKNMPEIEVIRTVAPVQPPAPVEGEVVDPENPEAPAQPVTPAPASPNEALKTLKVADINKIQKIAARYQLSLSDPTNPKSLTYEQAKQMISSFGFTEEELNAWLVKPEEI